MASTTLRQNLPGIAASIAMIPITVGLFGALDPAAAMKAAFGWRAPATSHPEDRKLALSLMRLYSYRSIGIGLSGIIVWYTGARRTQGLIFLANTLMAIGDGLTCYQYSEDLTDGFKHWYFIPISLGIGGALLGWI